MLTYGNKILLVAEQPQGSPHDALHHSSYMDKGILLATKTLVESICHYIRDPSGALSVCRAREWHIDKFPPFYCCCFKDIFFHS